MVLSTVYVLNPLNNPMRSEIIITLLLQMWKLRSKEIWHLAEASKR